MPFVPSDDYNEIDLFSWANFDCFSQFIKYVTQT